ncbi:MAG: FxsA family protein [Halioglobus sp.]|nr:FxsA family protein [Halioglobus sp.]
MRFAIMLLPWLELLTLIELGILTSALTALAYVFVTVVLGLAILRRQGRGMFERLRQAQDGRIIGPELLLDDMALGFAGLLLIFPGMISDFAALIVVIGPLRRRVAKAIMGPQPEVYSAGRDSSGHETIEGVYRQVDDENNL